MYLTEFEFQSPQEAQLKGLSLSCCMFPRQLLNGSDCMCLASPENLGREKADITGTLVLVRYNRKGTGAPNTEDEGKMREHLQTLSSAYMCGQSRGFHLSRGPAIRAGLTLQIPGGELLSTKGREASSVAQQVKNLLAMQETQEMQIRSLGQEDPQEKEVATHSNIFAWESPWTEEPGWLWSKGLQRAGHD